MNWQDANKRTWSIKLTLDLVDQIHTLTQVDLLPDDNDYREVIGLVFRPRKLGAVLWECSRKAAEAQNVSRESFAESLDSEAMSAGWQSLRGAIESFTMGQHPTLAEMAHESFELQMKGIEAGVLAIIDTMKSESTDEALREAVAEIDSELRKNLKSEMKNATREALANSATGSRAS